MTDKTQPAPTGTPAPAEGRAFTVRFSARDLLNVAIFVVIYFVIVFAIDSLGFFSPLVTLLALPLAAIAAGIPYMLFLTRARHAGMVALFGIVLALLYLMMGQPWQGTLLTICLSVIAEFVLAAGRYRSTRAAIWTYVVFSAWFVGSWIPFLLDPDAYRHSPAMESMGDAYLRDFTQVVTVPAVLVMAVCTVVCGFLGALLGTALLRKHFRKAGLA